MKGAITMIRENALGKKNSCHYVGLRYISRFLLPIVSVCCMQAWAEDFELVSASGATNEVTESGTYTASQDLTFGALQVAASPVTFDFSATPTRRVVFDGTAPDAVFSIRTSCANVVFNGGEWNAGDTGSFYCGGSIWDDFSYGENNVLFYNCVWTNLNRVYVARNVKKCELTMDGNSRVHAKRFFLMYSGSNSGSELNVLGGSGLYLTSDSSTAFYTDNAEGPNNGKVTVSGAGSTIDAGGYQFIVGNKSSGHLLVVSNNASVASDTFVVGNAKTSIGSKVLVADNAELTVKTLSVRNPGNSVIVSNAMLQVDSTGGTAISVGSGSAFVLSGEDACLNYFPAERVDVFATCSVNAEFRIENKAAWNLVGINLRSAVITTNSVFKVASQGSFSVGENGSATLEFGPGSHRTSPPDYSVSNRFEVCDGGNVSFRCLRLNGYGNQFVVSNAVVTFDSTVETDNELRIGYSAPGWSDKGWASKDCALVLRGDSPEINATKTAFHFETNSILRIEVPENGYVNGLIPLKMRRISFNNTSRLEIDCGSFVKKGGKVTLATFVDDTGLTGASGVAILNKARATLPEGCTLIVENKKLVLRCPRRRFVFSIR